MFREEGFKPQTKTVNYVLMNGGVGDHIASLTAIDYISKQYPWIRILLWVPDFLVELAKNVLPESVNTRSYTNMKYQYDPSKPTRTTEWDGLISPMKIHCVDYGFLKLCDELPNIEHKNYLQIKTDKIAIKHILPQRYVVITTGYTAKVREFPAKTVNEIAQYIKAKGYEVIFLGQNQTDTGAHHKIKGQFDSEIDYTAGLNLIDKTSLIEAASIINNATALVGVDNGLMHLAGVTETNIVGGFTTISPSKRWPIRHNQLGWSCYSVVPEVNCKFCQEKTNFLFGHDYRNCLYKDTQCTAEMTSDKFIAHLERIL